MQVATEEKVWELLEDVFDPEIPVLSVVDLGVVRDIQVNEDEVQVTITPTYSGCPAMGVISTEIRLKLLGEGFPNVKIEMQLSPAWTSDWLSEEGMLKLEEYGIAPPVEPTGNVNQLFGKDIAVRCPLCKSEDTKLVSQFGSTSCKALYQCNTCLEPFDYFKCLR